MKLTKSLKLGILLFLKLTYSKLDIFPLGIYKLSIWFPLKCSFFNFPNSPNSEKLTSSFSAQYNSSSYGKLVIINHSGGLQSRYAHLDSIKVTVGQQVNTGDLLGTVGTTGQPTSTQPHIHFEVRASSSIGWVAQDPKGYLRN